MNQFIDPRVYEVRAWAEPYWRKISLQALSEGQRHVGLPIVMKELKDEDIGIALPPTLSISPEAAQVLMDDLWRCGLRPSEGTGSAGALAATQSHLKDMRELAFKLLPEQKGSKR